MRRKLILATMILAAAALFASCGSLPKPEYRPDLTSDDLNIYQNGQMLCDRDGVPISDELTRDTQGNVLDDEGNVLISAANLRNFTWVTSVYYDKSQTVQSLDTGFTENDIPNDVRIGGEKTFKFRIMVEPKNTVNSTLLLTSCDPGALYFPYDKNADAALNTARPKDGSLPEIMVRADRYNQVTVILTARIDGSVNVLVKNILGEVIDNIRFELRASPHESGQTSNDHVHRFKDQTIAPTYLYEGYTIHTCEVCGYSYRDSFAEKLPHEHDYDLRIIPPTYTSNGYTLHICKICGETKRDKETPKLVCSHEEMQTIAVEPTCTEKGYTLHECQICKVFSFRGNETDALGHLWDAGTLSKEPSCTEEGEKVFICSRCGETRTESVEKREHYFTEETVPPTFTEAGYTRHYCIYCGLEKERTNQTPIVEHTHIYRDTVLEPTCTESGYTKHTCTVCGESFTDGKIGALGHDYVGSVTEEADCTHPGIMTYTCSRCGHSYTNNIPALGHAYLYTVIPATRDSEGFTEHTCKRCGDSYQDSFTPKAVE